MDLGADVRAVCAVQSRFSHVQLFATLWTVARQAPLSVGLSKQEYWSGLPFPSGKEYVKAVYCHPAYLTYMQSKS